MGVKRIWTDEQKADIKYLYEEEGWTIKQIEKKYKSGHGNISRMLDEMGVKKKFRLSKNRLLKEDYFEKKDEENSINKVEPPKKVTTIRVKCMKKF